MEYKKNMEDLTKRSWFYLLKGTWVNKNRPDFIVEIFYDRVREIHYLYGIGTSLEGSLLGTLSREKFLETFYKE